MEKRFADQVVEAIAEINERTNRLALAIATTSRASNNETDIRNKLNAAQKNLDTLMDEFRKLAPRDSDWKRPAERSL